MCVYIFVCVGWLSFCRLAIVVVVTFVAVEVVDLSSFLIAHDVDDICVIFRVNIHVVNLIKSMHEYFIFYF